MMDRKRQEKDLQEVFDATQAAYLSAIENTFALQERMLESLTEESRRHREAMETLVRESAEVYKRLLRSPFSHHQHHPMLRSAWAM